VRHRSPEAAQDRRPDPHQRAPGRSRLLRGIPRRSTIPPGAGPNPSVTALCQGAVTRPRLIATSLSPQHRRPRRRRRAALPAGPPSSLDSVPIARKAPCPYSGPIDIAPSRPFPRVFLSTDTYRRGLPAQPPAGGERCGLAWCRDGPPLRLARRTSL
jgi:hypothetical protein